MSVFWACIRYAGETEIYLTPSSEIRQKDNSGVTALFAPTNLDDFSNKMKYYAKWRCDESCDEDHDHTMFLKADILLLGG